MIRKGNWARQLADQADLHEEHLPGVPLVELAGDRRVLIEGHCGVTEYSGHRIRARVRYGEIAVCGCGLELTVMTRQQLVISGRIDCVELQRRGK